MNYWYFLSWFNFIFRMNVCVYISNYKYLAILYPCMSDSLNIEGTTCFLENTSGPKQK